LKSKEKKECEIECEEESKFELCEREEQRGSGSEVMVRQEKKGKVEETSNPIPPQDHIVMTRKRKGFQKVVPLLSLSL